MSYVTCITNYVEKCVGTLIYNFDFRFSFFNKQQEIQQQLQGNKLRTLQAMRDKAQADVERLWKKYEMSQNPRDMSDFEKAQQGLKKIESQMKSFRQSTTNLQVKHGFWSTDIL